MNTLLLIILAWVHTAVGGTVRMGVFLGNDVGLGQDEPLSHAEREARDMARVFQEMGDLTRERTLVLTGAKAPEVRDALYRTESQVREIVARGDEVQVVLYYSGHASQAGLHLSGTLLPMAAVRHWLEDSTAQVRIAFIDACESGTLARTRGGTPVDVIDVVIDDALTARGLAVVSSTGPLSVARESDAYGGGVFSRALLTGLRGAADHDRDGRITLEEAYRHAFEDTVTQTFSSSSSVQRPEYRFDLEGVGDVVLTRLPSRAAGLVLPTELEGSYTVVSVGSGQVVARVDKQPGDTQRLALPPGRYLVRKTRQEDVLLSEVDLVWGGDRLLSDTQMTRVPLGDPLARGGWSDRPIRLALRGHGSSRLMAGNPRTAGVEAGARVRLAPRLRSESFVGLSRGERTDLGGLLELEMLRAGTGLVLTVPQQRVDLLVGGGAQLVWANQFIESEYREDEDGEPLIEAEYQRAQLAPGAFALAGVHLPVGPRAGLELGLRANLYALTVDQTAQAAVEAQVYAGVTVGLGGQGIRRAGRSD